MAIFLSALPFVRGNPDSTTRRDRTEVGTTVAKLSYRWTVTERRDPTAANGTAQRYLVVELRSAIDMPSFRLHRRDGVVVLSEIDDTGTWLLSVRHHGRRTHEAAPGSHGALRRHRCHIQPEARRSCLKGDACWGGRPRGIWCQGLLVDPRTGWDGGGTDCPWVVRSGDDYPACGPRAAMLQ